MSQDKINLTRLKRQSSLFDVATTSYINLINEIAACSDEPVFKQHIKAFLKHLESDISSSAEKSQPSQSSDSTAHRPTSSIEHSSRRSSNDQTPMACPVTEALKASALLPPKESYHDTELAQAWSTLYLKTLHLSPDRKSVV